jgi:hypothetical protein
VSRPVWKSSSSSRLTVGRELKMIELKKENESLRRLVQMDRGEPDD